MFSPTFPMAAVVVQTLVLSVYLYRGLGLNEHNSVASTKNGPGRAVVCRELNQGRTHLEAFI